MKLVFKASVLRISLIATNFIFSVLSVALIALGAIYYEELSLLRLYIIDDHFAQLPILLIVLGVLSFLASIFGCYFARHHNGRFLRLFVAFLTVLLAMELTVSCIAFLNLEYETLNSTKEIMTDQLGNETLKESFTKIEERYECCGINGLDDYKEFNISNNSICKGLLNGGYNADGCAAIVVDELKETCLEIGSLTAIYSCLQVIDITCLLLIYSNE